MDIQITRQPAPTIPPGVQDDLDAMTPGVFLVWNSAWENRGTEDQPVWEPRWEIWCELTDVSHPDARHQLSDKDVWNTDAQCWMRFLQTYETAEGDFAPADERLIVGLQLADTWSNRRFYEDWVEGAYDAQQASLAKARRETIIGHSEYYDNYDRPVIGPGTGGDWRWRIR